MPTQSIYKKPELYELFSHDQDFKKEAEFVVRVIKRAKRSKGSSLLNVGCGTGSHDRFLKRHFHVTGMDLNPDMLRLARKKNPKIPYVTGDMKKMKLNRTFDVITALTGVMCYNYTYEDLSATLKNFHQHLEPGGVLVYDVPAVKETAFGKKNRFLALTSTSSVGDTDAVVIDYPYDPDKRDTTFETHLVFLLRKNRGPLQIISDRHLQGLFQGKKVEAMLRKTGFAVRLYENDFSGRAYKDRGPIYVCVKG